MHYCILDLYAVVRRKVTTLGVAMIPSVMHLVKGLPKIFVAVLLLIGPQFMIVSFDSKFLDVLVFNYVFQHMVFNCIFHSFKVKILQLVSINRLHDFKKQLNVW